MDKLGYQIVGKGGGGIETSHQQFEKQVTWCQSESKYLAISQNVWAMFFVKLFFITNQLSLFFEKNQFTMRHLRNAIFRMLIDSITP